MKTKWMTLAGAALVMTACHNNENEFDATGTFEATEVTVAAKATGELVVFNVNEGDEMTVDSLVGVIDPSQLALEKRKLEVTRGQVEASKRQLAMSRNATNSKQLDLEKQLSALNQQIANARRERQRYAELVRDGAVPRKQLDDIDYQIRVLEKQVEATRDQIRSNNASLAEQAGSIDAQIEGVEAQSAALEAQIAQISDQLSHTNITCPIKGTVLEKYVERGEYVTPSKSLFKIADTQNMFLRAYVTSAQLQDLKLSMKVKVLADYGDGKKKEYEGTVAWISSRSEFTPKTIVTDDERADLVYAVKVALKNDGFIKIGMYGEVKF